MTRTLYNVDIRYLVERTHKKTIHEANASEGLVVVLDKGIERYIAIKALKKISGGSGEHEWNVGEDIFHTRGTS